jgi:hypothetical protein
VESSFGGAATTSSDVGAAGAQRTASGVSGGSSNADAATPVETQAAPIASAPWSANDPATPVLRGTAVMRRFGVAIMLGLSTDGPGRRID